MSSTPAPPLATPANSGSEPADAKASPLLGLFAEATGYFKQFRDELAPYGLAIGAEVEVRDGQGLLCYYDLQDGHIHLSLPDPTDPVGVFQAAMFRSILHCDSEAELAELVRLLLPLLIAHEVGHLLRHRRGLFGTDLWFEEQVANKFAVALAQQQLSLAQRDRLAVLMRRTLAHLAAKVGSAQIATDTYLDPLEALGAAGLLAPTAVRSLELMDRLLSLSPERVLREMPQPPAAVLASFAQRQETIDVFNEAYSSGLARYIYFQFGWLLIHIESREHHYVQEVAVQLLGLPSALLPAIAPAAQPLTLHILSCYQAHRQLAVRSPVLSRYFFKRYRSLLIDEVAAAHGAGTPSQGVLDQRARRLLESQDDEDPATLDFLAVAAPPALRALFPTPLSLRMPAIPGLMFACETDQRLWQWAERTAAGATQGLAEAPAEGLVEDTAARNTLNRLEQLHASEIYRALPAELLVQLTHLMFRIHVPTGASIIDQGSHNDDVFIITAGEFDVLIDDPAGERRVDGMRVGDVAGDMAFLTGAARSATIRAARPSTCLVMRAADLKLLAFDNPAMLMRMSGVLIRRMAQRASLAPLAT